jgi:hypothetical protein
MIDYIYDFNYDDLCSSDGFKEFIKGRDFSFMKKHKKTRSNDTFLYEIFVNTFDYNFYEDEIEAINGVFGLNSYGVLSYIYNKNFYLPGILDNDLDSIIDFYKSIECALLNDWSIKDYYGSMNIYVEFLKNRIKKEGSFKNLKIEDIENFENKLIFSQLATL